MTNDQIVIYNSADGQTSIEIQVKDESVWLAHAQIVELFQSSKANISEHIKNIYSSEELDSNATVRKFRTVQLDGSRSINRERDHLYREDGTKRIADNALVALTLMIAESKPDEREMMVKVVVNLINPHNS